MRKTVLLSALLFLSLSLAAVSPYNSKGERIIITFEEDSNYALLREALKEGVSLEWYEKYTSSDSLLISSTLERLQDILPFENFVFSEEKDNAISVLNLADGTYLSFTFLDGKIHAIGFN